MGYRVSWFDVVGRALPRLDDRKVGAAIGALSATYRAGASGFDYRTAEGRAAYLWHVLPAHVCDVSRLLQDLPDLLEGRETLRVVSLGAGPGSDLFGLLDALAAIEGREGLEGLRRVSATRLDATTAWDDSFARLLPRALECLAGVAPGVGARWQVDAPARSIRCDLTEPLSADAAAALGEADLVLVANVLSELAPRGSDTLPGRAGEAFGALIAASPPGADLLLLDRAQAPGAEGRVAEVVTLARAVDAALGLDGPRRRTTRCGCALTRRVKEVYRHVQLPTTRDQDRPVRNCKTLWCRLRRSGAPEA